MRAERVPSKTVRASFPSSFAPASARAARHEFIEWALFWLLVVALALAPLWYGSNDLVAWGINAMCFPGLAVLYEAAILVRGESHPVGLKTLALPAALFAAVVGWAWLQTVTWPHSPLAHPIWGMAGDVLGRPLGESISVNRDLTTLALTRLITAASVFWLALQLCRHGARARLLLNALVVIICIYAAYALVLALGLRKGEVLGLVWDDLNLEAEELTMGRQLQRVRHQLLHREPKTATSDDVVLPLVDLCIAALRQRRAQQASTHL